MNEDFFKFLDILMDYGTGVMMFVFDYINEYIPEDDLMNKEDMEKLCEFFKNHPKRFKELENVYEDRVVFVRC